MYLFCSLPVRRTPLLEQLPGREQDGIFQLAWGVVDDHIQPQHQRDT